MRPLWLLTLLAGLLPAIAQATGVDGHWTVREGTLKYEVTHILHGVLSTSRSVHGTLDCADGRCRFQFRVPLASFDSADADRDRDMLVVVNAAQFPQAEAQGEGRLVADDAAVVQATVQLAGHSVHLAPTRFALKRGWWSLDVEGSFPLSLQELGIAPPALLGIPISDAIRIYVSLSFGSG